MERILYLHVQNKREENNLDNVAISRLQSEFEEKVIWMFINLGHGWE